MPVAYLFKDAVCILQLHNFYSPQKHRLHLTNKHNLQIKSAVLYIPEKLMAATCTYSDDPSAGRPHGLHAITLFYGDLFCFHRNVCVSAAGVAELPVHGIDGNQM